MNLKDILDLIVWLSQFIKPQRCRRCKRIILNKAFCRKCKNIKHINIMKAKEEPTKAKKKPQT